MVRRSLIMPLHLIRKMLHPHSLKLIYSTTTNGRNYSSQVKNRGGSTKIYTVNFHSLFNQALNKLHGDNIQVGARECGYRITDLSSYNFHIKFITTILKM